MSADANTSTNSGRILLAGSRPEALVVLRRLAVARLVKAEDPREWALICRAFREILRELDELGADSTSGDDARADLTALLDGSEPAE